MLNVPTAAQGLFSTAHKNIRVTFPNGEYSDICGDRIIAESVKMDESVCSENVFRFGSAERSTISFDAVVADDLTGLKIACFLEADMTPLSMADYAAVVNNPGDGQVKAPADTGLSYTVYRIPWGVYRVDTAQRIQGYSDRRHIEARTLAPWAWSPVERMRLDTWLGASLQQVRSFSPKDMLFANLGFWFPECLPAAGYTETWVKQQSDFMAASSSFTKTYESTGGGHTYKTVISGTICRSKLGLSDGLYKLELNIGDTEAAWNFFLSCYEDYNAPYPDVPQPTIPVDQRSPRCWLQPYIGYDLANWFAPGSHSGMSGQFNPCYWIPYGGDVPCLYITTDNLDVTNTFFGVMWDLTVTFSVDGTVKETGTFFPSSGMGMNVSQYVDSDPFPYAVEISPSATIAPDPLYDTTGSEYRCYSDSYDLGELLRSWLELHGQCMGFDRNGSPKIWSPADPTYGSASVPTSAQKFAGFWWDEIPPADVTRVLWSWDYEDDQRDMETSVAQVPAEWLTERGSTYDLRGNWILENLSGVSEPGDVEDLIVARLAPSLLAESSGERIMSFPAIDLTAMAMPWIEAGDQVTVGLSSGASVKSFAMSQSVTGIQLLTQRISADGGLAEVENE